MQWVALMLAGFLALGLRRSTSSHAGTLGVVVVAAGVLIVWFAQMAGR